jgi:hypothetical protein
MRQPSKHAQLAWDMVQRDPTMLDQLPLSWKSLHDVFYFFEQYCRSNPVRLARL